jgi:hypothetical protein
MDGDIYVSTECFGPSKISGVSDKECGRGGTMHVKGGKCLHRGCWLRTRVVVQAPREFPPLE